MSARVRRWCYACDIPRRISRAAHCSRYVPILPPDERRRLSVVARKSSYGFILESIKVSTHIRRLVAILVVLALCFVAGKVFFPPKSFWAYGHYRADSVTEIAAAHPTYLSPESFSTDYPKEYESWSSGIHKVVKCQICHIA